MIPANEPVYVVASPPMKAVALCRTELQADMARMSMNAFGLPRVVPFSFSAAVELNHAEAVTLANVLLTSLN